jgi:hypothetical protein
MSEQEFLWGLLTVFAGLFIILGLIILHEKANTTRTALDDELDQVLMRNRRDVDE